MDQQAFLAVAAIRSRGKAAHRGAKYLRSSADSTDQLEALRQLPIDDLFVEELLTGRLFARTWRDVFFQVKAPPIVNSQRSIDWLMSVFEQHSDAIRTHVALRKKFDCAALHGQWDAATDLLSRHQAAFGQSLWLAAWHYLVAEETNGITARRELTQQLRLAECGPHLFFLAGFFSISADKSLPESQLRDALANAMRAADPSLRQLFELLILEDFPSPHWLASEVLRSAEFIPLIDRYELFLRLATIAAGTAHAEAGRLAAGLQRIKMFCRDSRVDYLSDTMGRSIFYHVGGNTQKLLAAWDAHLTGDYARGYEISRNVAMEEPDLIVANETMVRCAMQLHLEDSLDGATPISLLWQHLRNVLAKNQNAEDSINYLRRLGRRFRIFSLTGPLRGLHARHVASDSGDELLRRGSFMMGVHSPRNFERGHTEEVSNSYLARCIEAFPQSLAMKFLRDIQLPNSPVPLAEFPSVPPIRQHLFAGLLAARRHNDDIASRNLNAFLDLQKDSMNDPLALFTTEEARKALADVYRRKDDVVKMQRVVVEAYQLRPASIRYFPVGRLFRFCEDYANEASNHIEYAILAGLACSSSHETSMAVRRFLNTLAVDRPSGLATKDHIDRHLLAILFLRVCTWDVLDSFPALDTTSKVESERLALLRWVSQYDPTLNRVAETEMLRLTQEGQLRDALERIEGTRVTVDLPGLKEAEYARFADAYFRFAAERELGSQIRSEALGTLSGFQSATGPPRIARRQAEHILQGQASEIGTFASAFTDIRDIFLSSPHFGVDACLSSRVRHGIVIQHLRRPFVERRLMVRSDVPERAEIESYWRRRLAVSDGKSNFKRVLAILFRLTRHVEAIAEEVKNIWIQIATESRRSSGLFDYTFNERQLRDLLDNRLRDVVDVDTFLDAIFDELLARTRQSLKTVQKQVREELLRRLADVLDDALKSVESLSEPSLLPLRNDLVSCRTEIERTCQEMARWFDYSDPTLMGDMDFHLVARTAVGMAERLNPDFRGRHRIECHTPYRLKGRYFTALVHILFFLLENAIRYSSVPLTSYQGAVRITSEGNRLCLGVENRMLSDDAAIQAVEKIRIQLQELRSALDPVKVVREGGTGFAKIIATTRYEFKQNDAVIEANSELTLVSVSLRCQVAGIAA
ncbi:MAG: hypothetical protein QOH88_1459 [Verrucomicrobiota bacterium]|jgi:hypothetical protein